jgi:hypothetical protein
MGLLWNHKKREEAAPIVTNGQLEAKQHLAEVRDDEVTVANVLERINRLRSANHFGESIAMTFRGKK